MDAEGKTYANLSERLRAVDAYYEGADAETVDGTAHGSLAKYIHEEWRNDYDLIRGGTFYKGPVDVSGLNTSDDMSGRVDPNGEGYYLLIPTGNLHDAKLNVLFYGLRGKPAIMRGNWGGMEGDFHYAGRLSIASTSKPDSAFRKLLDMIPDMDKELTVADFKEKFWNWTDLYFQGLDKLLAENYNIDQALSRLLKQTKAYDEEHFKPKKSVPLMMMAKPQVPSVATQPLFGERDPDDPRRRMQDMIDRLELLHKKMEEILDKCSDYQLMAPQVSISDKGHIQEIAWKELTDALCKFPIVDPYEICFAVLYMFDQDDDYIWTYGFAFAIATRAASMLPWGQNRYDADEDVYEPVKLEAKWYASDYVEDIEIDGAFYDSNLAQVVYEYSGGVLPRTMGRYDRLKPVLKKRGLKPAQIATACALMDALCEASRTCETVGRAEERSKEAEDSIAEKATERENTEIDTVPSNQETMSSDIDLASENERLRKELTQLREKSKKQLYDVGCETRELKEQLRVAA